MSLRLRLILLALSALVLVPGFGSVIGHIPGFGSEIPAYGELINRIGPAERQVANMVSAINFDIRGLDTLGEEFMLLAAIAGTVVLLRGQRGTDTADTAIRLPGRPLVPRAEAVTLVCRIFGPLIAVFGLYIVLHATVTPGGGFQGGVILASGTMLIYLGEGYAGWRRSVLSGWLDAMEGGGALVFTLCGLGPMLVGAAFMENLLPLGIYKDMLSGGLILIENLGVALAVTGGFTQLFLEFMEETREPAAGEDTPSE
ncbi:MnhB domain-containing protein [Methylobacterium haplocladii]|uniref:Na+/H+ antiporter MnhB subunit-related protein domain-containing protein n=1 Tax=Methylobacterium haplocladii TaxID=1176176 RepID=A0A512IT46_9HYPH|nr:MnhB domain-containing protein [Methylobacterium haplocladii]GEP00851.1 hypothetical protein MHA02_32380 [Methylobacterium haplocladii]GJD86169.1 hypothetical protein HPGCJGGD_4066 [Methylobacterium haplocladii]GLS60213.1 hypothetical protein GCM10007887_28910 [Methylobacterium haplocladii]